MLNYMRPRRAHKENLRSGAIPVSAATCFQGQRGTGTVFGGRDRWSGSVEGAENGAGPRLVDAQEREWSLAFRPANAIGRTLASAEAAMSAGHESRPHRREPTRWRACLLGPVAEIAGCGGPWRPREACRARSQKKNVRHATNSRWEGLWALARPSIRSLQAVHGDRGMPLFLAGPQHEKRVDSRRSRTTASSDPRTWGSMVGSLSI